jgi:hypothetical protein
LKIKSAIFIIACALFLFTGTAGAQQDSTVKKYIINKDTVEIGTYYIIYLPDYKSYLGKITAVNNKTILVYSDGELMTIDKMDIVKIEDVKTGLFELSNRSKNQYKNKLFWSFGAGYAFRAKGNNSSSYDSYENGFNFHTNLLVTLSNNFGIRTDLDYIHFPGKDYSYNNYGGSGYIISYTGGSANTFLIKFNLALGSLHHKEPVNFCALLGLGTGAYFRTGRTSTDYSSLYGYSSYTYSGQTDFTIGASAGFNVSFRLSDKLRFYVEPQANAWSGNYPNFYIIKTGITLLGN